MAAIIEISKTLGVFALLTALITALYGFDSICDFLGVGAPIARSRSTFGGNGFDGLSGAGFSVLFPFVATHDDCEVFSA